MTKDIFWISFDSLLSELHKVMVNKVTFVGVGVGDRHNRTFGSAPGSWFIYKKNFKTVLSMNFRLSDWGLLRQLKNLYIPLVSSCANS